jgi:hypothetical protein
MTGTPETALDTSRPIAPKQPWHPPTLEEIDYSATESSFFNFGVDFGLYT